MSMRRITDEHRGLLTVISLTQERLEEIGSDKLSNDPKPNSFLESLTTTNLLSF